MRKMQNSFLGKMKNRRQMKDHKCTSDRPRHRLGIVEIREKLWTPALVPAAGCCGQSISREEEVGLGLRSIVDGIPDLSSP